MEDNESLLMEFLLDDYVAVVKQDSPSSKWFTKCSETSANCSVKQDILQHKQTVDQSCDLDDLLEDLDYVILKPVDASNTTEKLVKRHTKNTDSPMNESTKVRDAREQETHHDQSNVQSKPKKKQSTVVVKTEGNKTNNPNAHESNGTSAAKSIKKKGGKRNTTDKPLDFELLQITQVESKNQPSTKGKDSRKQKKEKNNVGTSVDTVTPESKQDVTDLETQNSCEVKKEKKKRKSQAKKAKTKCSTSTLERKQENEAEQHSSKKSKREKEAEQHSSKKSRGKKKLQEEKNEAHTSAPSKVPISKQKQQNSVKDSLKLKNNESNEFQEGKHEKKVSNEATYLEEMQGQTQKGEPNLNPKKKRGKKKSKKGNKKVGTPAESLDEKPGVQIDEKNFVGEPHKKAIERDVTVNSGNYEAEFDLLDAFTTQQKRSENSKGKNSS